DVAKSVAVVLDRVELLRVEFVTTAPCSGAASRGHTGAADLFARTEIAIAIHPTLPPPENGCNLRKFGGRSAVGPRARLYAASEFGIPCAHASRRIRDSRAFPKGLSVASTVVGPVRVRPGGLFGACPRAGDRCRRVLE